MLFTISALRRTATTTTTTSALLLRSRTLSTSGTSGLYNKTEFHTPDPKKPRLVLAYSGGLDTSCQLAWLAQEKGFEVCAYIADLGQDDVKNPADVEAICAKAKQSGAYAFYNEDLQKEFVEDYIHPVVRENFFCSFFLFFFFFSLFNSSPLLVSFLSFPCFFVLFCSCSLRFVPMQFMKDVIFLVLRLHVRASASVKLKFVVVRMQSLWVMDQLEKEMIKYALSCAILPWHQTLSVWHCGEVSVAFFLLLSLFFFFFFSSCLFRVYFWKNFLKKFVVGKLTFFFFRSLWKFENKLNMCYFFL